MMKIFIADYLPIKNKGEEALLRGIQSLYEEKYHTDVEFCVFGPVSEVCFDGNITSYPVEWCYPNFKYPNRFAGRIGLLKKLLCAFLYRLGVFPYVSNISKHPEVITALKSADFILIAHDGFYHTFCAGLGLYLKSLGLRYCVPGTGFKPIEKYSFANKKLDYMFFENSDFNVLRENTCYDYLSTLKLSNKFYLLPDMAFYCESSDKEIREGKKLVDKYCVGVDKSIVYIGLTICENSISFHGSFLKSCNKSEDHRNFIAQLLDSIAEQIDCRFFFIPHCIENGAGNDLLIADDIFQRMSHKKSAVVIKEDLPVNVLRPFIQSLDFMIGERTHSIINSTSMCTPYFMLTSSLDFRSHDIIGKGVGLPNQVINLDTPDISQISSRIIEGIKKRSLIVTHLISYKNEIARSRKILLDLI